MRLLIGFNEAANAVIDPAGVFDLYVPEFTFARIGWFAIPNRLDMFNRLAHHGAAVSIAADFEQFHIRR